MLAKLSHLINVKGSEIREKIKSFKRSSRWDEVRDDFIRKNPKCFCCGSSKKLQVHHITPFSNNPELELVESNLISLCMDKNECHLNIGHGGSFKFYNPNVIEDSIAYRQATTPQRKLITENAKKQRLD